MMRRLIASLIGLLALSSVASAQCNGVFGSNTVCGTVSGSASPPKAIQFLAAPTGTISSVAITGSANTAMRSDATPALNMALFLANPTGTISSTAINGSASTAMRSDAAPKLDLSANYNWTGTHTFTPAISGTYVSFVQSPTISAVVRTMQDRLRDSISVKDFGAIGDGSHDDTAAVTNAIDAAIQSNSALKIPTGTYKITSALTVTLPAGTNRLKIYGDGPDSSIFYWPNVSAGLGIVYNSFYDTVNISDISFTTGQAGGQSNPAITLFQNAAGGPKNTPLNVINNATFRGSDGYNQTNYWATGVLINQVSNVNFNNSTVGGPLVPAGIGIQWQGAIANFAIVLNVKGSNFNGLNYGVYINGYAQGLSVTTTNFLSTNYDIYAPTTAASLAQVSVANSQLNANAGGVHLLGGGLGIMLTNNFFEVGSVSGSQGIHLEGTASLAPFFTIAGNHFESAVVTNNTGIYVANMISSSPIGLGTIAGNNFVNLNLGINVAAGSNGIELNGNTFASSVVNSLTNLGSSTSAMNNNGITNAISAAVISGSLQFGVGTATSLAVSGSLQVGTNGTNGAGWISSDSFRGMRFQPVGSPSVYSFAFGNGAGADYMGLDTVGNFIPNNTNSLNLGLQTNRWKSIFGSNADMTGTTIISTVSISSSIQISGVTYANRPITPTAAGSIIYVTDATTNSWGAPFIGGGTNKVLGFFNGAAWTVFGK